ncbi:MAG: choice-of-anchor D domain-containing protein [Bryobacteraceae bacterium]
MIRTSLQTFALAALLAAAASAQTAPPFAIRVTLPDSTLDVADGATITLPAGGIGLSIAAGFQVTNRGTFTATVNSINLTGSTDFTLTSVAEAPFTVAGQGFFGMQVAYKASTSNRVTGRLQMNVTYNVTNTTTASATIGINLIGVAPEFVYSAIPQGSNQQPLTNGGLITFPNTPVDQTANAVIVVSNRGSYQGVFNAATVTGAEFALAGVPIVGTVVDSNREIRFNVTYTPKSLDTSRGTVGVETADRKVTFNLAGTGTGARFTYQLIAAGGPRPLNPNSQLTLPDVNVNEKSSITVRFTNAGNADGRIAVINASGTGFSVSESPLLPLVVTPDTSYTLTVNFQPTTPGRVQGRLRIGADDFDLTAVGLGPVLNYAYVINNVATTVPAAGSIIFTPAAVGASSSLRFTIANTGTSPTTVSSIGLAAPTTIFTLRNIPNLPVNVQPNQTIGFDLDFAPVALGNATATLRVDNLNFTLTGAGNAPPPLPAISFDGATGTQDALTQPAIGLTIARAYPLALTGSLTLAFNSDVFSNDPAVQFATGGRTVAFTIPANQTRAIFANNANQIRVQTGSVAGTITVTPSINTTDGGINLTPTTPPSANLSVAAAAPRLLGVSLSARTANTITLLVSGYATNRSVTQIQLAFTPTSGENVTTTSLTLPVESAFLAYYQGTASAAFGSLFSATIPLTLAGDLKNVTSLADTLQSVSVTISNRVGNSSAVSLQLR